MKKNQVFAIVTMLFITGLFVSSGGASVLATPLAKLVTVDELQVYSVTTNAGETSYAMVYWNNSTEWAVLPLEQNGIAFAGSKYLEALLQQSISTGTKVWLHARDTWGVTGANYFGNFDIQRIRAVILPKN